MRKRGVRIVGERGKGFSSFFPIPFQQHVTSTTCLSLSLSLSHSHSLDLGSGKQDECFTLFFLTNPFKKSVKRFTKSVAEYNGLKSFTLYYLISQHEMRSILSP